MLVTAVPASTSAADAAAAAETKPKKSKSAATAFHGKISAVDKVAKTITLEGKEKGRVIQITSETKMTKDGKPAMFDAAVVGEQVGGHAHKGADGKLEATSLHFGAKSDAKAKKHSSPKPATESK